MARDLVLMSCVLFCLGLSVRHPFVGILAWAWIALMQPYLEVYGPISAALRINFTIAFVCVVAWLFSKERANIPKPEPTIVIVAVLFAWMTFNTILAVAPWNAWNMWDRVWKTLALAVLIWATANNKVRIHALIWVLVLAFTYYGIKSGILNALSGGSKKITGAAGGMIGDNNHFAVGMLMILPPMFYLRQHTANRLIRLGLTIGFPFVLLAVVGSYSRGALVAVGALSIIAWTRSRNKIAYLISACAIGYAIYSFMPPEYFARMNTLNDVNDDASFMGRVNAWMVAFAYARDHFPMGSGLDGTQEASIFFRYAPGEYFHVAHSIYFEMLGDNGFMGLGLYLTLICLAFFNCARIRKATRNNPDLLWAFDLATMIQLSLVAYCVGGAALSLAYFDLFYIWVLLLPPLWFVVSQRLPQRVRTPMGFHSLAPRANEGGVYASNYPTAGQL